MSLGIFVEGSSDRQCLPILIRKKVGGGIHVRIVESDEMLKPDAMIPHIESLKRSQTRLSKLIIFKDSEGVDPEQTLRQTHSPERCLNEIFSRPRINYVIVDHSIEGWLAWDTEAVVRIAGGNIQVSLLNNPEGNSRPATLLDRFFRANGRDFRKTTHNQQIAELANVNLIARNSPTFRRLVKLLRTP